MKRTLKRICALLIATVISVGFIPTGALAAEVLDKGDYFELTDGYLSVKVSKDNGGFLVDTLEGDIKDKSDDNKHLLYPDEHFDTSFTSFRVTRGGEVKDYVFGRDYGFLSLDSSDVTVTQLSTSSVAATWTVEGITFKQILTLLDPTATQHGMVKIDYEVTTAAGSEVDNVEVRVLMDTALGKTDSAIYQLSQADGNYITIEQESIVAGTDYNNTFFAHDNATNPTVTAYLLNATVNGVIQQPDEVAFGHWNNLASTAFDFVPNTGLTFTNAFNLDYMTADSAFALYYDLGGVNSTETTYMSTYYGVYSNITSSDEDKVSINVVSAPTELGLTPDGDDYDDGGDFSVTLMVKNISEETIANLAVAVYPETGINSYDQSDNLVQPAFSKPYYTQIIDLEADEEREITLNFTAEPMLQSQYRKLEFAAYETITPEDGLLIEDERGDREIYIYCPGSAGSDVVTFFSTTPETIFYEGTRNLYLSGLNFAQLRDPTAYSVRLRPVGGGSERVVSNANFSVDRAENTAIIVLEDRMTPGVWQVVIDWNDPSKVDVTSESLQFTVSNNPGVQELDYGIATVEKVDGFDEDNPEYEVGLYTDEADYKAKTGTDIDRNNKVYLELRGDFSPRYDEDTGELLGATAVSIESPNGTPSSTINISNALDVENGEVVISIENGDDGKIINIDIDAEVYTTGSRTPVWDGVCAITSFEDGSLSTLIQYDSKGLAATNVDNSIANTTSVGLLWPGAASKAQTIAGMFLELRYCQFGMMATETGTPNDNTEKRRIITFGAALSPDFLIPSNIGSEYIKEENSQMEMAQLGMVSRDYGADELRDTNRKLGSAQVAWQNAKSGSLSLYVQDVIFGSGGFIGFNGSIEVGIPPYIDGMPSIEGTLSMRIMDEDWAFGIAGEADFSVLSMEAEFALRSYNGIPVPDTLYFYMGGFSPGVPIDPFGVLWLMGAGGGVDKIYDTIFVPSVLPPITVMLSGEMGLFSTLSARANLGLSPRGVSASLSNITVAQVQIIDSIGVNLSWYPRARFAATLSVSILDLINGDGSWLIEENPETPGNSFFEAFIRASINIPSNWPFVGGSNIASADLGFNFDKVWGAVQIIRFSAGVTYYWGGDVEFGTGIYDTPEPTVELLASGQPVAVGYDTESGRVLYAQIRNMSAAPMSGALTSNGTKTEHTLTLGDYGDQDAVLNFVLPATSESDARSKAERMTISGAPNAHSFKWLHDNSVAASEANAMYNYNDETKTVSVTMSFIESEFNNTYTITTPVAVTSSDVVGFTKLPTLTGVTKDNDKATITGDLGEFDEIIVVAQNADDDSAAPYPLYKSDAKLADGTTSVEVDLEYPTNMPSGNYVLRAYATSAESAPRAQSSTFSYTNPNQPKVPTAVEVTLGGDYSIDVSVTNAAGEDYDGYRATILDSTGEPTIFSDLDIPKDEDGTLASTFAVGGRYTTTQYVKDKVTVPQDTEGAVATEISYGLEAGKSYTVVVSGYKNVDSGVDIDGDGTNDITAVLSAGLESAPLSMVAPTPVSITVSAQGAVSQPISSVAMLEASGIKVVDVVDSGAVTLNISGVTSGTYKVDNNDPEAFSTSTVRITDLSDGIHTIAVRGENATKDAGEALYLLAVDTVAPKLMLSSGASGYFDGTSTTISGMSEPNAKVYMQVDGGALKTVTPDENGDFSETLTLDDGLAYQNINVWAEDVVGNRTKMSTIFLVNSLLASEGASAVLYLGNEDITNKVLDPNDNGQLKLGLKVGSEVVIINDSNSAGSRVVFSLQGESSSSTLTESGMLDITAGGFGTINATLDRLNASATFGEVPDWNTDPSDPELPSGHIDREDGEHHYNITIKTEGRGDVTPNGDINNVESVKALADSTFTFTPKYGNDVLDVIVDGVSVGAVTSYTFEDVYKDHTLEVIFSNNIVSPFGDVTANAWFFSDVMFVLDEGLMLGITETDFAPDLFATRAMIWTVLARVDGADLATTDPWYEAGQLWAVGAGISDGTLPDDMITREQLVTMIYRYIGSPEPLVGEIDFNDADKISIWAEDALAWAIENGIINGKDNNMLDPKGNATRAEIAAIVRRLVEYKESMKN